MGRVEIGGWLPIGRANVVPAERVGVWDRSRQFIFELASRAPGLTLTEPKLDRLGKRLFRVDCRVANDGHLPTNVTQNGAKVSAGEGVIVEVERTGDVEFVAGRNFANIGHLPASGFRDLSWVVRTKGSKAASLTIVASAAHAGKAKAKVTLK